MFLLLKEFGPITTKNRSYNRYLNGRDVKYLMRSAGDAKSEWIYVSFLVLKIFKDLHPE